MWKSRDFGLALGLQLPFTKAKGFTVTIKSLFHVQSRSIRPAPQKESGPLDSIDVAIEWDEERPLRGVSEESWMRARGWSTED